MTNGRNDARPDTFGFPKWTEAPMTPARHAELANAARAYAAKHPSDPYTYGRIFLYMKRGIMNAAEVMADARGPASS